MCTLEKGRWKGLGTPTVTMMPDGVSGLSGCCEVGEEEGEEDEEQQKKDWAVRGYGCGSGMWDAPLSAASPSASLSAAAACWASLDPGGWWGRSCLRFADGQQLHCSPSCSTIDASDADRRILTLPVSNLLSTDLTILCLLPLRHQSQITELLSSSCPNCIPKHRLIPTPLQLQ